MDNLDQLGFEFEQPTELYVVEGYDEHLCSSRDPETAPLNGGIVYYVHAKTGIVSADVYEWRDAALWTYYGFTDLPPMSQRDIILALMKGNEDALDELEQAMGERL